MARKASNRQELERSQEYLRKVAEALPQVATQHLTSTWMYDFVAQKFLWHALLMQTIHAVTSIVDRNIKADLFNVYLILASRWFAHHEAVEVLLPTGRYGDCMILLRSLLEDTDLMTYFAFYPEDAAEWRERLGRPPNWSDNEYRQGVQKFRMPFIWRQLEKKGIEPLGQKDYAVLSATVHATSWGAQYYGRTSPEDPERLYLSFVPTYDPTAAFTIGLVLQQSYPRPIHAFLESCKATRVPRSLWRSIEARFKTQIETWTIQMKFDWMFRDEITDAVARITRGEEQEAVIQDLIERFRAQFGSTKGDEA